MSHSPVNEGIQANTVQAEVIAVGRGARASKGISEKDTQALGTAVAQLREGIARLEIPAAARDVLQKDAQSLADVAKQPSPDKAEAERHLTGIAEKLKMVGLVLNEVVDLAGPAGKIADLLHVPLTFLTGM